MDDFCLLPSFTGFLVVFLFGLFPLVSGTELLFYRDGTGLDSILIDYWHSKESILNSIEFTEFYCVSIASNRVFIEVRSDFNDNLSTVHHI